MENYLLFLIIASAAILSPGPGVIFTLSNSIRYGLTDSIRGILGISFGTFIVATVSATSLGLILATSALAFAVMKYVGALYLIYLGVKLWRSPPLNIVGVDIGKRNTKIRFIEGALIQISNPKAIFFFLSIFPQFIDYSVAYVSQFSILVLTYSALVILIHLMYALISRSARNWLSSPKVCRGVNKVGGGTFMCFGVGLATANK